MRSGPPDEMASGTARFSDPLAGRLVDARDDSIVVLDPAGRVTPVTADFHRTYSGGREDVGRLFEPSARPVPVDGSMCD